MGSYPTFSPLPAACPKARRRRYVLCDTVRRRALKRAARACGEACAASCPAVSGLSSPNFSAGAALPAPWDQRTRSDDQAPKRGQRIRDQADWQARRRGRPSRLPVDDAAALVAGRELGDGVGGFAARGRLHLTGDFQVAAAALGAVDRHDDGEIARRDAVVDAETERLDRRARRGDLGLGGGEFGAKVRVALAERGDAGLVAGDVGLQLGLGGGEACLGAVDRVHHLELLALEVRDRGLGELDLVAHGLVLVVLADRQLLGAVIGELGLGGADLRFEGLLAHLQVAQLRARGLDRGLFRRDLALHLRDFLRYRLHLRLEGVALQVTVLQDKEVLQHRG